MLEIIAIIFVLLVGTNWLLAALARRPRRGATAMKSKIKNRSFTFPL
jgi:hypothetical protein